MKWATYEWTAILKHPYLINSISYIIAKYFVTADACMISAGSQSSSILYMPFTASAVAHTVEEMKKENL
jgi:hypothetical protein